MPFLQEYHSIILFKIYKKLEEILISENSKSDIQTTYNIHILAVFIPGLKTKKRILNTVFFRI